MKSRFFSGVLFAASAAIALASCGGGSTYGSPAASSSTPTTTTGTSTPSSVTVAIVGQVGNQAFDPDPAMVSAGGTVTFKNNDATTHHIVMDDGSADLGEIAPGASKTVTLKGGGGNYHCVLHASMVGSINGSSAPVSPTMPPCDVYGYGC